MQRDYQLVCEDSVLREWQTHRSTLAVAPTGTGKSHIIAGICKRVFPKRVMVLSYRKEIILQLRNTIEQETGYETGVEMADMHTHAGLFGHKQVVVSTVQTQISKYNNVRRMVKFPPGDFGVLVLDESHHAPSKSSRETIEYYQQNPDLRVLGLTATPDRHDAQALGQIFESVAFNYQILDAINDGWLVYPDQRMVSITGLDFSKIHTTAGDLNSGELATVMEYEHNILGVADATLQIAKDKRTIVFTASVMQAEAICNIFNRHNPGCSDWVCGETPDDRRTVMLERFKSGDLQIICNCDVLTEGYDNPSVEVIAMAAPTKSRAKYAQRVGRCLRPLANLFDIGDDKDQRRLAIACSAKPHALILDFVGNSGRHKLMNTGDILGGDKFEDEVRVRAIKLASEMKNACRMVDLLEQEQAKLEEERRRIEERRAKDRARRANLKAAATFTERRVNAFDNLDIDPTTGVWDSGRRLSPGQLEFLKRNGVDASNMTYKQGMQEMIKAKWRLDHKPATEGQAVILGRFGLNPTRFTKSAASKAIDKLKANGWKPLQPHEKEALYDKRADRGGDRQAQLEIEEILRASGG